jgi:hypothetical protein
MARVGFEPAIPDLEDRPGREREREITIIYDTLTPRQAMQFAIDLV